MSLTAREIFEDKISSKVKEMGSAATKINAVYEFQLTGDDASTWTLDLTPAGGGAVSAGSSGNANCTVIIATSDLSDIVDKKLNAQMAFMSGKLKVTGDMGLALKLASVL